MWPGAAMGNNQAPIHPWNIFKQDKETVSFVVFVYAVSLSLILMKLCSIWNFISFLAAGYVTYIFGGPYFCFRWLVFMTGMCWFLFEMIMMYPLHAALLCVGFYVWCYLASMTKGTIIGSRNSTANEYRLLRGKVDRIEDRTEQIQQKMEKLEDLFRGRDAH